MNFSIGEVCIYVRPGSPYYGREVIVESGLVPTGFVEDLVLGVLLHTDELSYHIGGPNIPPRSLAKPEWLRKKHRDIDKKVEWSECLWQPGRVTA